MAETQDAMAQAADVLTTDVYVPAFVKACAEQGLQFQDEESVRTALESVSLIKLAETSQTRDLTKAAHADLCKAMGVPDPEQTARDGEQRATAVKTAQQERIQGALNALRSTQQ